MEIVRWDPAWFYAKQPVNVLIPCDSVNRIRLIFLICPYPDPYQMNKLKTSLLFLEDSLNNREKQLPGTLNLTHI